MQKLLGTTKTTINAVRERTHWNMTNIKPQDPVSLGICSQTELAESVEAAEERDRKRTEREARQAAKAKAETVAAADPVEAVEPVPNMVPEAAAEDGPATV